MKLPASIEKAVAAFDNLTLRERALVSAATLAAILIIWMTAVQDPIEAEQRALSDEMASLEESIAAATTLLSTPGSDPASLARPEELKLQADLDAINAKLEATSAGLIPPERMVQVIQDVLSRQRGIVLVSLHNKSVTTLVETAPSEDEVAQPDTPATLSGPYMHPVELILEGRYLDIMAYLHALEALPWHFYWKVLELESTQYPMNRVRIELGTLSMDKEWLGV